MESVRVSFGEFSFIFLLITLVRFLCFEGVLMKQLLHLRLLDMSYIIIANLALCASFPSASSYLTRAHAITG